VAQKLFEAPIFDSDRLDTIRFACGVELLAQIPQRRV